MLKRKNFAWKTSSIIEFHKLKTPMDDVEDINDGHTVDDINFNKLKNKLTKVGYADGITAGRDSVFQIGFDQGYADGLKTGLQLDSIKSFHSNLNPDNVRPELAEEIKNAKEFKEAKDRYHFKYLTYKEEPLSKISEHQTAHLEELKANYSQIIPITMENLKNIYK